MPRVVALDLRMLSKSSRAARAAHPGPDRARRASAASVIRSPYASFYLVGPGRAWPDLTRCRATRAITQANSGPRDTLVSNYSAREAAYEHLRLQLEGPGWA